MTKLKKAALYTDFHIGAKGGSLSHLQDCENYIDWFIEHIKNDKTIDHIIFLGDWHDKRDSINILTMKFSYECLKKLNDLNLKIYFMVGNHDIFNRHNVSIHSLIFFQEFNNINLIEDITVIDDTIKPILLSPYLFNHEYIRLLKYPDVKIAFLHPDFNGFVMTGTTTMMEHGQNPEDFKSFDRIFCGHYHKRSSKGNITYIGNCFPHNFADANDTERGFATYEYLTDKLEFFDWAEAPTYIRCNLSDLLENPVKTLRKYATVRCLADIVIDQEESSNIKEKFIKQFNLREFTLEEQIDEITIDGDVSLEGMELESTDIIIEELIKKITSDTIDPEKLLKIFKELH